MASADQQLRELRHAILEHELSGGGRNVEIRRQFNAALRHHRQHPMQGGAPFLMRINPFFRAKYDALAQEYSKGTYPHLGYPILADHYALVATYTPPKSETPIKIMVASAAGADSDTGSVSYTHLTLPTKA